MPSAISAILVSTAVSQALDLKVQLCVSKFSDLSILIAHASVVKLMARTYTLKRRAEQQAETRQRIVEAAVDLHGTVGPALTTFSMVAEHAGVQRHTLCAFSRRAEPLDGLFGAGPRARSAAGSCTVAKYRRSARTAARRPHR